MAFLTMRIQDAASGRGTTIILFVTSLGVFIAQLDSMVVNLAVKHIGTDLNAGVSQLQWVLDSYNLLYATLLLTGGTLGDLYGRTRLFATGIGLIVAGSVLCAAAPNALALISGRAITGIGAALEVPTSLSILTVAYPNARRRSRAIGIWASCNGIAIGVGPTIGGLLVDHAGWRSIFALVIPVCILAMALAIWRVPESRDPKGRQLDPVGQALAITALASLAFVAIEGLHRDWSPSILVIAALCVVSGALFVWWEQGRRGALVPLELFANSEFSASLAIAGAMTFGMYAMLFLTPLYLQSIGNMSAGVAGVALLPLSIVFVVVSQFSGALTKRLGARVMTTAGMFAMGFGILILTLVSAEPSLWLVEAALLIIGVGLGLNTGPINAIAVASVPPARSGTASGLINTTRMIGATLGIAVLGTLFALHAGSQAPETMIAGLRMAYIGGGTVELAGALVAFCFIRHDSAEQPGR